MTVRRWPQLLMALGVLSSLAGLGATTGCMQTRDAINQVQPDYLDKSQLIPVTYAALVNGTNPGSLSPDQVRREPQWYHQVTIVDKPATTGASGVTSYTQVERVNWEVTERFLVARQSYDRLTDGQSDPSRPSVGNNPRRGEIVAMYAIQSHFDIRRQYNATTGEELNVVVENSTDRPWYLRRFMRVDWSTNLLDSFTPLQYGIWQGRVMMEPQASYFNNPEDPNRPVFDYGTFNGQDGVLRYFDVTNRTILRPETANIPSLPNVPACLLYDRITESCQPADVLMRQSFYRVDPMRDYQPQTLDGHRMERFGFFESDRQGYSAYLNTAGQLERRHFSHRHNLWQQHHARMADGALSHMAGDRACQSDFDCASVSETSRCDMGTRTCGEIYLRCAPTAGATDEAMRQQTADAQCAGVGVGATCDLDIAYNRGDNTGLCLLPYRQRRVRPIAYHLSPNYPERIMPVTLQVAAEWNRVFSYAVREARYRECLLDPAGGGPAGCESWRDLNNLREEAQDGRHVWVACHNPVWGTDQNLPGAHTQAEVDEARARGWDLEACGPQGTVARVGDMRYSMMASVNQYDQQGPWGLAGITGDPVSGEVLSGRGAVWQTVTDTQAAFATDMIRLLNRERDLSVERFALGQTVLDAYDPILRQAGSREARANAPVPTHPRPVHRDISTQAELQTILAQTSLDHLRVVAPEHQIQDPRQLEEISRVRDGRVGNEEAMTNALARRFSGLIPGGAGREDSASRMARMRGSELEARLVNNREALLAAGLDPQTGVTPQSLEAASPARRMSSAFRTLQQQMHTVLSAHECRYNAEAFSDDVITVMLRRFRRNEVPEDVRFGQTWNFHTGDPAPCPDEVATDASGNPNCALNYEVINRYLVQFIHYGVMAHEIGHSIGERHNFSGSVDAFNYFDQFWPLRRQASGTMVRADELRPRWEHMAMGRPFYSQQEEQGGVEEYAYSSVMDYVGWNQDAHGLGRYDRAFVLHGYVDMVEAFDTVEDRDRALNMFHGWEGGYQPAFQMSLANNAAGTLQATSYHYTDIPRIVGVDSQGNPNITDANRYNVFLRETSKVNYGPLTWQTPDHTNVALNGRDGSTASEPHVLVPHRFGTDDWANYLWHSQRYDAGADMFESMRNVSTRYMDYYFSNSFARNRASFTVNGYRSRMIGRYLDQAYYAMRTHVYLDTVYRNAYGTFADTAFSNNGIVAGRLGVATVSDMFANAILMPQSSAQYETSGRHYLRTRPDSTRVWDRVAVNGAPTVDVPIGQGRDYSTYYDYGSGQFWRERILNVGAWHDKDLSLNYLTDTFLFVPGRTTIDFQDFHPLQINAYTIYPGQTLRFFGSLLARDHGDVGAQVRVRTGQAPEIVRTQYSLLNLPAGVGPMRNGRDPALTAIDPNMGFTTELQTLAYLFGQLANTFDRTALYSLRLCAEGDAWCLPATATRTLVTFTNPFTGQVYSAPHIGGAAGEPGANVGVSARDAAANETGIAARMLLEANRLAEAWRTAPAAARGERQQELQIYIDLLDRMRDMNNYYRDVRDPAVGQVGSSG